MYIFYLVLLKKIKTFLNNECLTGHPGFPGRPEYFLFRETTETLRNGWMSYISYDLYYSKKSKHFLNNKFIQRRFTGRPVFPETPRVDFLFRKSTETLRYGWMSYISYDVSLSPPGRLERSPFSEGPLRRPGWLDVASHATKYL